MSDRLAILRASLVKAGPHPPVPRVPLGHDGADLCLKGGVKRGALHEVFAEPGHEAAASGFAAGLALRLAANKPVLWITQDFPARECGALAATGVLEFGLDPARLLLLQAGGVGDALQAAHDALSCAALGAVVLEIPGNPKRLDLTASRRLALAAAQKNVTVCVLRFMGKAIASAAETRWQVRGLPSQEGVNGSHPVFEAGLIRHRNGGTGRWIMEWSCDHGLFQTAHSGAVVPLSANRPVAAREGPRNLAA